MHKRIVDGTGLWTSEIYATSNHHLIGLNWRT